VPSSIWYYARRPTPDAPRDRRDRMRQRIDMYVKFT